MTIRGWVYIITNQGMPGLVKVGFSTKDPALRAEELNHTGSPYPYLVDYDMLVVDPATIEQKVHIHLKDSHAGKEWFKCSTQHAIAAIRSVAGGEKIHESVKPPAVTYYSNSASSMHSGVKVTHDARLREIRCWKCGAALNDQIENCPKCGSGHPLK
jgi:hypothetical protein